MPLVLHGDTRHRITFTMAHIRLTSIGQSLPVSRRERSLQPMHSIRRLSKSDNDNSNGNNSNNSNKNLARDHGYGSSDWHS